MGEQSDIQRWLNAIYASDPTVRQDPLLHEPAGLPQVYRPRGDGSVLERGDRWRAADPFGGNPQAAEDLGQNLKNLDPGAAKNFFELAIGAMPAVGARSKPQAGAKPQTKTRAYDTHEAAPYGNSGHLEGMPARALVDYAKDPRASWSRQDEDALFKAMEIPQRGKTVTAQGFYEGPNGPEYNPVMVARPRVSPEPTDAERKALSAASAMRGLVDVQGGTPHSIVQEGGPPGANDALMDRRSGPVEKRELRDANQRAGQHGMIAIDTADGILYFDPMGGKAPAEVQAAASEFPGTRPVRKGGDYVDLSEGFERGNAGQGIATRKAMAYIDELPPDMVQRLSQSPDVAARVQEKAALDAEYAAKYGLPQRQDVGNLRDAMSTPGWRERIDELLAKGVPLPVIAAFMLGSPGSDDRE